MPREIVKFEPNVPMTVTLQYAEGRIVEGRFGEQVMFSLHGNQMMYLDMGVAEKINALEPAAGESVTICKTWNRQRTQRPRWDVSLSINTEKTRAAHEAPRARFTSPADEPPDAWPDAPAVPHPADIPIPAQRASAVHPVMAQAMAPFAPPPAPQGTGTNGPARMPQQQPAAVPIKPSYQQAMTAYLIIAGRAATAAEKTLGPEGSSVRFDSRDIAALATTLMIQAMRDGRMQWRQGEGQ